MSSPWRVRNSSRSDGSGQSRTSRRPPGRERRPRRAQDRPGRRELVERVLEVDAGRTRRRPPGSVTLGVADHDPVGQPGRRDVGPRPRDRVGLELDADQLERREPAGHGDEPAPATAMDVDDASAARQVGDELRQLGERLLEEDRDVLRRQALDGDAVAIRSRRRSARPVRKKSSIPPQSSEATAACTNWPPRYSGRASSSRMAATSSSTVRRSSSSVDQVVGVRRPGPGLDGLAPAAGERSPARRWSDRPDRRRGCARTARARRRGRPATTGGTRRGWRSGRRIGRRGPSSAGLSHGGQRRRSDGRVPYRHSPGPDATVRDGPGFWGTMDTDSPLIAALADDLDGSFEALVLAHQDRLYSIALRVLGDPRDAEEAAQDAFVRAYRALAGYDAARIRELRLRPWLATIVLNLCRLAPARRPAPGRRRCRSTAPLPARLEPRADEAARPAAAERRASRRRRLGGAAADACRRPTGARSCCATSTACPTPSSPTALDRPEGTVKAQVHRGLALLRTAFEAAQRREREEMTA